MEGDNRLFAETKENHDSLEPMPGGLGERPFLLEKNMDLLKEIKTTRDLFQKLESEAREHGDNSKCSAYHIAWNELEDIIFEHEEQL